MFSYGLLLMDTPVLADQQKLSHQHCVDTGCHVEGFSNSLESGLPFYVRVYLVEPHINKNEIYQKIFNENPIQYLYWVMTSSERDILVLIGTYYQFLVIFWIKIPKFTLHKSRSVMIKMIDFNSMSTHQGLFYA